jgi:hypothetical protein
VTWPDLGTNTALWFAQRSVGKMEESGDSDQFDVDDRNICRGGECGHRDEQYQRHYPGRDKQCGSVRCHSGRTQQSTRPEPQQREHPANKQQEGGDGAPGELRRKVGR